jgi:hypothetical protein
MTMRLWAPAIAIIAAGLLAGCGSGGSTTTSGSSPTTNWADGVCSAITTYRVALEGTATTLKSGNISKEGVQQALDSLKGATGNLADELRALGKPQTAAAASAKQTLAGLSGALKQDASTVREAADDSSVLTTVSVVSTTLLDAQAKVKAAVDELRTTDARGELKAAFTAAPSCASVTGL